MKTCGQDISPLNKLFHIPVHFSPSSHTLFAFLRETYSLPTAPAAQPAVIPTVKQVPPSCFTSLLLTGPRIVSDLRAITSEAGFVVRLKEDELDSSFFFFWGGGWLEFEQRSPKGVFWFTERIEEILDPLKLSWTSFLSLAVLKDFMLHPSKNLALPGHKILSRLQ